MADCRVCLAELTGLKVMCVFWHCPEVTVCLHPSFVHTDSIQFASVAICCTMHMC